MQSGPRARRSAHACEFRKSWFVRLRRHASRPLIPRLGRRFQAGRNRLPSTPMAPADENRRAPTAGSTGARRLAIVLANYNQAAHLAASVERLQATCSLLLLEAQLILVDDGSTDATWRETLAVP